MCFDYKRILEYIIYARNAAIFNKFTLFESIADVTYAAVLNDTSREILVALRFSTI